jgi:hypothetical protein
MSEVKDFTEYGQVIGTKRLGVSPLRAFLVESARRDAVPGIFALTSVLPDRGPDFPEPDLMVWLVAVFHAPPLGCG